MQTREIDLRLQQYTAAEHRIAANLHELDSHSVYQLLTNDDLVGQTATQLNPALNADPSLWQMYHLLESTLAEARRVRADGRITTADREHLAQLLGGSSVALSSDPIGFANRDLTSAATTERRVSIDALINLMRSVYEPLRDGVAQADQVIRRVLPRLNAVTTSVGRTTAEALDLGVATGEAQRINRLVNDLRERCLTDPLSVSVADSVEVDQLVHRFSESVAQARASHDALIGDLAAAHALLDECRSLLNAAQRHLTDATLRVADPIGMRNPPTTAIIDGPQGLAAMLTPIATSSEPWQTIRRRLEAWSVTADRLAHQLRQVESANRQPLDRRDELRGRLSAFRAKMAGTATGTNDVLHELAAEAYNELFTAPTDLARAARLVSELGEQIAKVHK